MGRQERIVKKQVFICDLTKQEVEELRPEHKITVNVFIGGKWRRQEFELSAGAHESLVSRLLESPDGDDETTPAGQEIVGALEEVRDELQEGGPRPVYDSESEAEQDNFFEVSEEDDIEPSQPQGKHVLTFSRDGSDPANTVDLSRDDETVVRADGTVLPGKVLKEIRQAATARRHTKRARCSECAITDDNDGVCTYGDGGVCVKCGMGPRQEGEIEDAAHNPLEAKGVGYDHTTGAHTFPVDIMSPQVQRKLRQRAAQLNDKIVAEAARRAGKGVRVRPDHRV